MYLIKTSDRTLVIVIDCSEPCKWVFMGNLDEYEYYACSGFDYFGIYFPCFFDDESGNIRKKISVRLVKQLLDKHLHCFISQYSVDSYKKLIKN